MPVSQCRGTEAKQSGFGRQPGLWENFPKNPNKTKEEIKKHQVPIGIQEIFIQRKVSLPLNTKIWLLNKDQENSYI